MLNKVTKFHIPTPNRLGIIIEKPPGAESAPQGIGLKCIPNTYFGQQQILS